MFSDVTKFLDKMIDLGVPGIDCIVYKSGREVYRHLAGYSNFEEKIPVSENNFYNIYSCTKIVTCVAALQLYEKGMFKLDDDLSDYMPEFKTMYVKTADGEVKKANNSIKIIHLFTMTAGLNYESETPSVEEGIKNTNGECPTREMIKYMAKEPLEFEPGEGFKYSFCHDVLAGLIEVLTGMTFGEYLNENIFKPAGMTETYFVLPDEYMDRLAEQYRYDPENKKINNIGKEIVRFRLGSKYESGGAGLISTTEDFIKFLEAVRKYVLIKKETVDLMQTDMLPLDVRENHFNLKIAALGYSWGLGVRCPKEGSGNTDFGWGGAAGAYYLIDTKNEITCFYVQHMLSSLVNDDDTEFSKTKLSKMLIEACK